MGKKIWIIKKSKSIVGLTIKEMETYVFEPEINKLRHNQNL